MNVLFNKNYKSYLLIFAIISISMMSSAQNESDFIVKNVDYEVSSIHFEKSRDKLNAYLKNNNIKQLYLYESNKTMITTVELDEEQYNSLRKLVKTLRYIKNPRDNNV